MKRYIKSFWENGRLNYLIELEDQTVKNASWGKTYSNERIYFDIKEVLYKIKDGKEFIEIFSNKSQNPVYEIKGNIMEFNL